MVLLREGPLHVAKIGHHLSVHKTTAWRLVNGLAKQGLVKRADATDVTDKRVRSKVELLPDGLGCLDVFASKLHKTLSHNSETPGMPEFTGKKIR